MNDKNERNLWTPSNLNARSSIMTAPDLLQAFTHTPVFNRPDLDNVYGKTLAVDNCGLNRALEFVALPGTVFQVVERSVNWNGRICKVTTNEYPSLNPIYVDVRFCEPLKEQVKKVKVCPSKEEILKTMLNMVKCRLPYVWGGNVSSGVELMKEFYPFPVHLCSSVQSNWLMRGVDCSGMLYEATNGFTPRNTSELCKFGKPLEIERFYDYFEVSKLRDSEDSEKKIKEYLRTNIRKLISILEPLDIVVWCGHVFIVFDQNTSIESRFGKGCHIMNLVERFEELMGSGGRSPVNNYEKAERGGTFTIRRWYT